ncbi:catalase-like [Pieris brassicae]|uniref:catalase-like n=1 Tax=Pieris brassicae TaxID=7116 RepID=UPI001E6624DD|nr:catalase-like [Pieris brassicae]
MHRFILLIPLVLAYQSDSSKQLEEFKDITKIPIGFMTTSNGAMVETKHGSSTLNTRLIYNEYFMDSLTHFSRERIPERVVHANGAGAFGFFEVTHDISHICKARLFSSVGKKTPIAIRFSTIANERGASNTVRDARGFAVKFYTEDGNLDIVGLNQPTFVLKDPLFFTTFAHTMKRNPATDLPDANAKWDFLTLRPESWNTFIRVFGDRGIFDGYRYMPGFSIHTYQVTNEAGTPYFVRFHFIPNAGEKTLTSEDAAKIQSTDPDYEKRDLYRAIAAGNYPSWLLALQILSLDDVKNADIDVFDITKILPVDKYPLHHVGQLVLDRTPENFFAEVEQLAYNPANLVPGIQGGVDKLFEARRLSYRDALYYRLGANFNNIRVNCPFNTKPLTYNRDGRPPVKDNQKSNPNYHPNSFNGAVSYVDFNYFEVLQIIEREPNNTEQIRDFYLYGMSDEERNRLIENIRSSLVSAARFLQKRAIALFESIHPDFGYRVDQALASNFTMPF